MQADINYPKSKAFNIFLRFLQSALCLLCTLFVVELINKPAIDSQFRMVEILIVATFFLSFIGIITIKCSSNHPKVAFFILFLLNIAIVACVGYFSFRNLGTNSSALEKILYEYYIGQSILNLLIVLSIFILPLLWIQRYTNSPGNLVWPGLFLLFAYKSQGEVSTLLLFISASTLLISSLTFIVNLLVGFKGITTAIKTAVKVLWFIDLILAIANEVLAVRAYIDGKNSGYFSQDFASNQIKVLLQIFVLVNIIDLIFWLYGYQTLSYQNGDSVRDDLVKFGKNPQYQEESEVNRYELQKENRIGEVA